MGKITFICFLVPYYSAFCSSCKRQELPNNSRFLRFTEAHAQRRRTKGGTAHGPSPLFAARRLVHIRVARMVVILFFDAHHDGIVGLDDLIDDLITGVRALKLKLVIFYLFAHGMGCAACPRSSLSWKWNVCRRQADFIRFIGIFLLFLPILYHFKNFYCKWILAGGIQFRQFGR